MSRHETGRARAEGQDGAALSRTDATRHDILLAATAEFAAKGLSGARVDEIAARTRTTKPAIYYHFGSKAGLYTAVLEAAYGGLRDLEARLDLDALAPLDALRRLVELSFDYHEQHPDWVRLVMVENLHGARHLSGSTAAVRRNAGAIDTVRALLRRGEDAGVFRPGLDPLDLHWMISALCFHRVSNRATWTVNFGCDLLDPGRSAVQRRLAVEAVLCAVRAG